MITNHTQLLQALIDKYELKSYLELGVQNPDNNFDKIKCNLKFGVDPEIHNYMEAKKALVRGTSDNFFKCLAHPENVFLNKYDLVFIDGDHTAEQVKRDFENSLKCLSDEGFIVVHDVLPQKEETTLVPRNTRVWHGSVYKFAMCIRNYPLKVRTYNIDEGIMVVQKVPGIDPFAVVFPDHLVQKQMDNCTFKHYLEGRNLTMTIQREVII